MTDCPPQNAVNQPPLAAPAQPTPPRESWRSDELLEGKTEILILHGNEVYRLRRTRQDKLILYK